MALRKAQVDCQNPNNQSFIKRVHTLVEGDLRKGTAKYDEILHRAVELANAVNPGAANDSEARRDTERIRQDALAGMIAEQSWLSYINHAFGKVARSTPFEQANGQIDILLNNGMRLEVRSSFVKNGIKFGVCHEQHNFNVVGAYSNLYKPGEVQKSYYLLVLFETAKNRILTNNEIKFGLVAGATSEMMKSNGYDNNLIADGDVTAVKTKYRLLKIKNAHDIMQFENWMQQQGYNLI